MFFLKILLLFAIVFSSFSAELDGSSLLKGDEKHPENFAKLKQTQEDSQATQKSRKDATQERRFCFVEDKGENAMPDPEDDFDSFLAPLSFEVDDTLVRLSLSYANVHVNGYALECIARRVCAQIQAVYEIQRFPKLEELTMNIRDLGELEALLPGLTRFYSVDDKKINANVLDFEKNVRETKEMFQKIGSDISLGVSYDVDLMAEKSLREKLSRSIDQLSSSLAGDCFRYAKMKADHIFELRDFLRKIFTLQRCIQKQSQVPERMLSDLQVLLNTFAQALDIDKAKSTLSQAMDELVDFTWIEGLREIFSKAASKISVCLTLGYGKKKQGSLPLNTVCDILEPTIPFVAAFLSKNSEEPIPPYWATLMQKPFDISPFDPILGVASLSWEKGQGSKTTVADISCLHAFGSLLASPEGQLILVANVVQSDRFYSTASDSFVIHLDEKYIEDSILVESKMRAKHLGHPFSKKERWDYLLNKKLIFPEDYACLKNCDAAEALSKVEEKGMSLSREARHLLISWFDKDRVLASNIEEGVKKFYTFVVDNIMINLVDKGALYGWEYFLSKMPQALCSVRALQDWERCQKYRQELENYCRRADLLLHYGVFCVTERTPGVLFVQVTVNKAPLREGLHPEISNKMPKGPEKIKGLMYATAPPEGVKCVLYGIKSMSYCVEQLEQGTRLQDIPPEVLQGVFAEFYHGVSSLQAVERVDVGGIFPLLNFPKFLQNVFSCEYIRAREDSVASGESVVLTNLDESSESGDDNVLVDFDAEGQEDIGDAEDMNKNQRSEELPLWCQGAPLPHVNDPHGYRKFEETFANQSLSEAEEDDSDGSDNGDDSVSGDGSVSGWVELADCGVMQRKSSAAFGPGCMLMPETLAHLRTFSPLYSDRDPSDGGAHTSPSGEESS